MCDSFILIKQLSIVWDSLCVRAHISDTELELASTSLVQEGVEKLEEFLTRAGSAGTAHIHNLGENTGVSVASAWAVTA